MAFASITHAQQTQPFNTVNLFGFGAPLNAVQAEAASGFTGDLDTFATGQMNFIEVDSLPELGP
ncbi:MAG TPA: hypothetical protein VN812_01645, partial [Candidatus Acidoferrales bacterium]|nr:hypothetical protein [Candidatus Acidoferrales bacterium]